MIKSMTGFAKVEKEYETGKFIGEARALNSRYLEINLRLPRGVDNAFEQRLRELVKKAVRRGKVDIIIKWERVIGESNTLKINEAALKQYLDMAETLRKDHKVKGGLVVENIFSFKDVIVSEEGDDISGDDLASSCVILLDRLNEEKAREGKLIGKELKRRLRKIIAVLDEIETRWPAMIKGHEARLRERIMETIKTVAVEEARVLQELVIYMDKLDISEEIFRLRGHMENFKSTLKSKDTVGRKLDFVIQEMLRETNTIGSKASDLYINKRVVEIKVEIEKMREQVQNIE